jgi:hypothetical protein
MIWGIVKKKVLHGHEHDTHCRIRTGFSCMGRDFAGTRGEANPGLRQGYLNPFPLGVIHGVRYDCIVSPCVAGVALLGLNLLFV